MPKLYFGSRGGMYYKRKGRKVYVKRHRSSFGMDYAVPGVLGGLGQGYVDPDMMYSGFGSTWSWPWSWSFGGKSEKEKMIEEISNILEEKGQTPENIDSFINFLYNKNEESIGKFLKVLKKGGNFMIKPIEEILEDDPKLRKILNL